MKVFVFQAALYCQHCGQDHRDGLPIPPGADIDDESTYDSDQYPKGPYPNGGGEADCPQHCADCRVFLENPLTSDGVEYVREAMRDYCDGHGGNGHTLNQWRQFYGVEP